MKIRFTLATATALGLLMGSAVAGDNNLTNVYQNGERNSLLVEQNGSNNIAGKGSQYGTPNLSGSRLFQGQGPSDAITGNDNQMAVRQSGDYNKVGTEENGGTNGSYIGQLRNQNVLNITQTTAAGGTLATNGNTVLRISQNSATAAQVANNAHGTNILNLTQTNGAAGGFATHYFGQVGQSFRVRNGQPNTVDVLQEGSQSAAAARTGNRVNFLDQSGSANDVDIIQKGAGLGGRGAYNIVHLINQNGNGHVADITQEGANNYIGRLDQLGGDNNRALITLRGEDNGAVAGGGAAGAFTAGRAAAAAGVRNLSGVYQNGSDHAVEYTVDGGNGNRFGFDQRGTGNEATGIVITGNSNELAVYQNGVSNRLELSAIAGESNIIGLRQTGSDNVASLNVSGDRNVGYRNFTSGVAGTLAAAQNLAPGLLVQDGNDNSVSLTVSLGNDNVFASLQDGNDNTIGASQSGSFNQAAVIQVGNQNVANLSQIGSYNNVSISQ